MPQRRCFGLTLLLIALTGVVGFETAIAEDAPKSTEETKQEILQVNEAVGKAIRSKDTDGLARLLCDDFVYTNQTGELLTKEQMLANIRSGKLTTVQQRYDSLVPHIFGNTVVLTGISRTTLVYDGNRSDGPRRFTRVYVKQDGVWRLAAQHVSLVPSP
jgi:uncharacterized protein (TIGR02246 family)